MELVGSIAVMKERFGLDALKQGLRSDERISERV